MNFITIISIVFAGLVASTTTVTQDQDNAVFGRNARITQDQNNFIATRARVSQNQDNWVVGRNARISQEQNNVIV